MTKKDLMNIGCLPRRTFCASSTILLSSTLVACDSLIDLALDCIDNDRPVLSPIFLPNPILNQVYNQTVHVRIRNEPFDDSFDYAFQLEGSLPTGLQTQVSGRDLRIFGTPTVLGDFNFVVRVRVLDNPAGFNNTQGLCSTIDTNGYEWTVQPV